MTTLAFSYVRFSSEKQKLGTSLQRQLDRAREYATTHNLTLDDHSYRDLGVCGWKGKNRLEGAPGAFIKAVDDGKVPARLYLLIEKLGSYGGKNMAEKNAAFCLTSTGDCQGIGSALFAPGAIPFWGVP